ncbi:DUF3311 domain-containing protein [Rhodococcus sp. USK13]|uniref:DUF3311 domain-containing protein n=1 Tax=Rhodococcus sp. USK13 TaxID=2806442 RepID=UPI001BCF5381|nr:DUF3311 domain-containing protein [Rhodococcus sp. USK13]
MSNEAKSALLAIGVPFAGVLGGIVALAGSTATVFGVPILFAWLFLWMPLTSLCLHLSWKLFDRRDFEATERAESAAACAGNGAQS